MSSTRSLFVLLLFFATNLAAQPDRQNKIGLRFTAARAGYRGLNPTYYPSYSAGLQYVHTFNESAWGLATGLNMVNLTEGEGALANRYRFVQVPLNLRLDINHLYLEAGIFSDYLLVINSGQSAFSPLDPNRTPTLGWNAAAGYEIELTDHLNALLEFRYFAGIVENPSYRGFRSYGLGLGINYGF
jgi:hypothetical protein